MAFLPEQPDEQKGNAMRALLSVECGGPETLVLVDDAPIPQPAEGQVRVRVHAAALNFPDLLRIEDNIRNGRRAPSRRGRRWRG